MRFQKWQALGNDYAILEERELPFELTPERIRRFCAPHTGVGSDGILLVRESDERGFVAEIRIYNPDGSEAELSGNGVREAVMYLRRSGWTRRQGYEGNSNSNTSHHVNVSGCSWNCRKIFWSWWMVD